MTRRSSLIPSAVIAAAFLGPGTVATASRAGHLYGFRLLWALIAATVACYILQEAVGRIAVATGKTFGRALHERYGGTWKGPMVCWAVAAVVVCGCVAFQAGNLLGGVSGISLIFPAGQKLWTALLALSAAGLLWFGRTRVVLGVLGLLVAVMGVAFLSSAAFVHPSPAQLAAGVIPSIPEGGALLVLGLVGTTVVPYNLFLGSRFLSGETISSARRSLALMIGAGGLISVGVLISGALVAPGEFSLQLVADSLESRHGGLGRVLFALGLFAAGFSSAITAPLAASLACRDLLDGRPEGSPSWSRTGRIYRFVWVLALGAGAGFGFFDLRPEPLIILAQALNGFLLPLIVLLLWRVSSDRALLAGRANGPLAHAGLALVFLLVSGLAFRGLWGLLS